jgi:hypothetical protein
MDRSAPADRPQCGAPLRALLRRQSAAAAKGKPSPETDVLLCGRHCSSVRTPAYAVLKWFRALDWNGNGNAESSDSEADGQMSKSGTARVCLRRSEVVRLQRSSRAYRSTQVALKLKPQRFLTQPICIIG